MPIATDHNKVIDYWPIIEKMQAEALFDKWYKWANVGEEVTTKVGHFNVFPLDPARPPIDHTGLDWRSVSTAIEAGTKVSKTVRPPDGDP